MPYTIFIRCMKKCVMEKWLAYLQFVSIQIIIYLVRMVH